MKDKRYGPGARAMANEPGTERKKITPGKQGEKPKVEPDPDKAKPKIGRAHV